MAIEKWLVDDAKTITVDLVRNLKVGLIGGKVDIVGHDEPGARIEVHSVSNKPIKITMDGDTLEIDHPQLGWDNFIAVMTSFKDKAQADISIVVPRDVALKFGVVSATALISGLTDDAKISTVSGDVVIDSVYGDLDINSVSGEINIRNHYGNITSNTVSGDITASGEIMKFNSNSVSGDVFLDVAGTPDSVTIKSVSGDITLRLESGVAAQYTVNTMSGRLQLDDSSIKGVIGQYTSSFGKLDGQWVEFTASTISGSVSVLHSATAESAAQ